MSRVKRGIVTKKRHKRWTNRAKGFWGQRKNVFRRVKETVLRAMAFAYKGRKLQKRSMRQLFITRISAAARENGMSYHMFMFGLKKAGVALDRKMLSQLAIAEPQAFTQLVERARTQIS